MCVLQDLLSMQEYSAQLVSHGRIVFFYNKDTSYLSFFLPVCCVFVCHKLLICLFVFSFVFHVGAPIYCFCS